MLRLAGATDYRGDDPSKLCRESRSRLRPASRSSSSARHTLPTHRALFRRVELELEGSTDEPDLAKLPTDERLARVKEGGTDAGLVSQYFQFGRYLLMGSSRPGTMPANLQGIWNEHMNAPWNADYHTNINIQMNYWPAEVGNLAECHTAAVRLDELDRPIRRAHREGPLRLPRLGRPSPVRPVRLHDSGRRRLGHVADGRAWLAQHAWEHFAFGGDKDLPRADRATR